MNTLNPDLIRERVKLASNEEIPLLPNRRKTATEAFNGFIKTAAALSPQKRDALLSMFYGAIAETTFNYFACAHGLRASEGLEKSQSLEQNARVMDELRNGLSHIAHIYGE